MFFDFRVLLKSLAANVTCFQTQAVELVGVAPAISPGELLVQLNACGICGTDLAKVYESDYFRKPVQLGHELVATVVESQSARFRVGQRVAIAHAYARLFFPLHLRQRTDGPSNSSSATSNRAALPS